MYDIFQLMDFILQQNGSDLHLSVGRPPTIRVSGRMRTVKGDLLTPDDTVHLANQLMPPRMKLEFREKGGAEPARIRQDLRQRPAQPALQRRPPVGLLDVGAGVVDQVHVVHARGTGRHAGQA